MFLRLFLLWSPCGLRCLRGDFKIIRYILIISEWYISTFPLEVIRGGFFVVFYSKSVLTASNEEDYQMSSYMLIRGDCMDSFGLIHDHSVNLVLADPPYGITQNTWDVVLPFDDFIEYDGKNLNYEKYLLHCFKKNIPYKDANEEWNKRKQHGIWSQLDRILADRGVVILFSAGIYTKTLMESTTIPWRYNLIWQKTTPVGFLNANRMPLRAHEDILVFYKKLPTYNPQKTTGHPRKVSTVEHKRNSKMTEDYGKYAAKGYDSTERFPTSVLTFATDKQKYAAHGTQKPVALCEWLIKSYTNEDDTVLDFCMGSGSTGVAANNTKRNFIGIEKDADFFDIAKKRIEL